MSPEAVLEATRLRAGYGELDILHGIDLRVAPGGFVTVIGPNGAGKSTLLKTIYGLLRPRSGSIRLRARDGEVELAGKKPYRITALGMNYVPQLANVFPRLTLQENLEVGATVCRADTPARMEEVFAMFPTLRDRRRERAGSLSGGQRQMLALARALMTEPRLLLLDEPSAGLAPKVVDEVFDKLAEINSLGVAILIVEQNARRSLAFSDYGYVLDMGHNRFEGPGPDLLHDPKIIELYLGGSGRLGPIASHASAE
jgi:branched-chain amino acid transport system ATP-binding protein/neutral amino acid transport system ATP-binding protein